MLDASAILLTNKIAVVTGGGRGLGEAIALNMAAFGADVAVLDIDEPAARRTAERVREVGRRSLALRADVGVREDVDAALDRTRRELGEIDILVNNAADLTDPRPALTISDDRFDHFVRSSLGSVWLCSTTVARRWIELDRPGVIVNLATTEAIRGCPAGGQESLAGIAPFIPLRRYGTPDDTAALAIFLASDMSAWITGQTIVVDGGSLACARVEGPLPLPMFLDLEE